LNETEAAFYLAAYQNPSHSIKELQKATGLSTPSPTDFEKLKESGLLTASQNSWRKNIQTISLKTLAEKVGSEQRKLRKVELE